VLLRLRWPLETFNPPYLVPWPARAMALGDVYPSAEKQRPYRPYRSFVRAFPHATGPLTSSSHHGAPPQTTRRPLPRTCRLVAFPIAKTETATRPPLRACSTPGFTGACRRSAPTAAGETLTVEERGAFPDLGGSRVEERGAFVERSRCAAGLAN
jgi:hypothetical protein